MWMNLWAQRRVLVFIFFKNNKGNLTVMNAIGYFEVCVMKGQLLGHSVPAMYLGKLRDIPANELKTGVTDVVIAVPGWFSDIQRQTVIDAAAIANLNVLHLINDTTATALGYGIIKANLPDPGENSPSFNQHSLSSPTLSPSFVSFFSHLFSSRNLADIENQDFNTYSLPDSSPPLSPFKTPSVRYNSHIIHMTWFILNLQSTEFSFHSI